MTRHLTAVFVLTLAATCCGCHGFELQWHSNDVGCQNCDPLAGRWRGTWNSDVTGHSGQLRAIVTPLDGNLYEVRYKATFAGILPYEFTVPTRVTSGTQEYRFQGEADLGRLAGGEYNYNGFADSCQFVADYCAEKDHGTFHMWREPCDGCRICESCDGGRPPDACDCLPEACDAGCR